ncbi:MAG: hypothetical protein IT355_17445 [Gemmatimonadaceae bacterium]|nr:hypothetical protein [Gemmatimonadaceae bacterium]
MFYAIAVILFIAAEFVIGWWALPVVGLVLGLVGARRKGISLIVGAAGLTAWLILFGWSALAGSHLPDFMVALASSMKLKPTQLVTAIAAIPALLATPAARLGAGLRPNLPETTQTSPH